MSNEELAFSADDEGILAALAAAGGAHSPRGRHRDRTDACPALGRLLLGAESGVFDQPELSHLCEDCRYCQSALGLAFAEACPPRALYDQAGRGALRGALAAHAETCGRYHPEAPAPPRPAPGLVAAVRRWWNGDPTRRLGAWLGLGGVAVTVVGLQSRSYQLPWSSSEIGLGLATGLVGYYLASPRDHLAAPGPAPIKIAVARCHRGVLALALLSLALCAGNTARLFRPFGSDGLTEAIARLGMAVAAVFAGTACLIGVAGLVVRRYHRRRAQPEPGRSTTAARLAGHPRCLLTRWTMSACGVACVVYASVHGLVALRLAPNLDLRLALVAAAALLLLVALESFHPPLDYARLVIWIRWGIIPFERQCEPTPTAPDLRVPDEAETPGSDRTGAA